MTGTRPRRVKRDIQKPHPFDEWYDELKTLGENEYVELLQGMHFKCSVRSFAEQFWRWARRHEVQIEVQSEPTSVLVRLA